MNDDGARPGETLESMLDRLGHMGANQVFFGFLASALESAALSLPADARTQWLKDTRARLEHGRRSISMLTFPELQPERSMLVAGAIEDRFAELQAEVESILGRLERMV